MQAVVPRFVAKKLCGFFHEPEANLDVGFALRLQAKAKAAGADEMAAVRWLCRPDVQQNLELWVERTIASNLDGERRFAQAKRAERGVGPVRNLASAARDHLHDRFIHWRQELVGCSGPRLPCPWAPGPPEASAPGPAALGLGS